MKQRKFMRRMMTILLGVILIVVSVIQIVESNGNLGLNLLLAFLGLFEIGVSIAMMRLEKKKEPKINQ